MPAFFFLVVHKDTGSSHHPEIFFLIGVDIIGLTGFAAVLLHIVVLLDHLPAFAVENHQFTIAGCDEHLTIPFAKEGHPELLGHLVLAIAIFNERQLLGLRVNTIDTVIVGLHPEILLGIDIKSVNTTLDAPFLEFGHRVTVDLLGHRVEDTEVHALLQPYLPFMILPDLVYIVVTQCCRIVRIRIIGMETVTIISVQTIGCSDPYKSLGILEDIVDL